LTKQEQERVRAALALLKQREPNQTALAKKLHVRQQTISSALGSGSIGVKLSLQVARLIGVGLEELLGRPTGASQTREPFSALPGWAQAQIDVLESHQAAPHQVRAVAAWPNFLATPTATVGLVIDLVGLWVKYAPLEERIAAEREHAEERPASGSYRIGRTGR
jgi:hypothetical protein